MYQFVLWGYSCLSEVNFFGLYCVSFSLVHGIFAEHAETLVLVHLWANVILVTCIKSIGVSLGFFFGS